MSARDVAGAVVWSVLAASGWFELTTTLPDRLKRKGTLTVVAVTFAAVFCIARLLGAHA